MVFIISFSAVLTLNFRPLFYHDMKQLSISENTGYSDAVIKENYDILIDYNNIFGPKELSFKEIPMSDTARIHFQEVKAIFVGLEYVCLVSLAISLLSVFLSVRRKSYSFLKVSAIITVLIPAVLGILIGINWDTVFITFHELVFNNNYWIFDPVTDPIILFLPDEFFMHSAVMIVALTIFFSLCLGLVYILLTKAKNIRKHKHARRLHIE